MTIPPEVEAQILRLHHVEKWRRGTIARQLHVHHGTVTRVLAQAGPPRINCPQGPAKIDPYLPLILESLQKYPKLTASRLFAMVCERGYKGSPDHFRHLIACVRPRPPAEAYLRRRTLAGEESRVDWAPFNHLTIGRARRPLMAFVMVLSFSRQIFLRFFLDARMENFVRGHAAAFATWNGCPRILLYDNLRSAVLERHGDAIRFHPTLFSFAAHYRFEPRPVAVARGNEKGRVERAIRYARESFFAARRFSDLDDLNRQAADWCNGLAADRPCPENRDVTVREAFAEEAPKLLPLPDSAFPLSEPIAVKIGKTPYVRFDLPTDHRSVAACQKTSQRERARRRASITYTLRIEYATYSTSQINVASASGKPSYLPSTNPSITEMSIHPNWSREFTVLGRHTLEQLNEIILHILGWEQDHLFEFRFADRVHAHLVFLDEDTLFVDAPNPCTSCDIRIRHLHISAGDVFAYVFDFGDYHSFRITVRDIRPTRIAEIVPALLCFQGKNIIQYPGFMRQSEERLFRNRPPMVVPPQPARDWHRIRFIREEDGSVLREWRASNNKKHWQKAVTILESRNLSPKNIATKIERSEYDVERWIRAFNRFGLEGLKKPDGRRGPVKSRERERRAAIRDQKARRILEIVHAKPSAYGINRSSWHRPSIVRAYEQEHNETISVGYTGHLLRQFGYAIRKARKVLMSPDPHYREKVDLLLSTLQNLKLGELFFFVDELGPLRVKKYGGRALVRKNEVLTYPQEEAHRGVIMMSGALSATTNQMTWVYGRAKDTGAMIDLLELLYNQYFSSPKLYVTWDTASWHKSAMLIEWLDAFNATTRMTSEGPLIELVPLPTSSQFLDVIEAVFSGMKRGVIHHSNYRDASEMKKAISLHFTERNVYFRENPRRAGNQVWKIDFFDNNENIRSANYREW